MGIAQEVLKEGFIKLVAQEVLLFNTIIYILFILFNKY